MQKFIDLLNLITRLRAPDGCPWDQKQTPQSFKPYILEEAHELAEAVDHGDPDHIREELGDLLFQVAFLNRLYEEAGHFDMNDVLSGIIAKMIRRHPHVFADTAVTSEAALRRQWNEIKASENSARSRPLPSSTAPPKSLPALKRAQRVSENAAQQGFEWPDLASVFDKLAEELQECRQAIAAGDQEAIKEEVGDLLFVLVNLGRLNNTDTEAALQDATDKFTGRFTAMEKLLAASGTQDFKELPPERVLGLWQQSKKNATPRRSQEPNGG